MSIPRRNSALMLVVAAALAAPFLLSAAVAGHDHGETLDLQDLADGETREFGDGDHRVVATREGDAIRLEIGHDGSVVELARCAGEEEDCKISLIGAAGEPTVAIVRVDGDAHGSHESMKIVRLGDHDGEGLTGHIAIAGALDGDGNVFFEKLLGEGDADILVESLGGDGTDVAWVTSDGADANAILERLHAHGGHGEHAPKVLRLGSSNKTRLRCPEGDASLTVDKDEADDTFYCPKHEIALERAAPKVREILLKR